MEELFAFRRKIGVAEIKTEPGKLVEYGIRDSSCLKSSF
jgi:hypothetical protein